MDLVAPLAFVESFPVEWKVSPRSPIAGNFFDFETGTLREMFKYDLQCMYREGHENDAQENRTMPGFGSIVTIALYTVSDINIFITVDLYVGTFRALAGFNPLLVPGNSRVNIITLPRVPCYRIKGAAQKVTPADPSTDAEFSVQITDY